MTFLLPHHQGMKFIKTYDSFKLCNFFFPDSQVKSKVTIKVRTSLKHMIPLNCETSFVNLNLIYEK